MGILLALVLALGVTGTVQMADMSAPGDKLYGMDQAVESFQLRIATGLHKENLRLKFAQERLKELELMSANGVTAEEEEKANIQAAINLISGLNVHERGQAGAQAVIEKLKGFAEKENVRVELVDGYIVVSTDSVEPADSTATTTPAN